MISTSTVNEVPRGVVREFDDVPSVERAYRVGSLDAVIDARTIRPQLIERIRGGETAVSQVVVTRARAVS